MKFSRKEISRIKKLKSIEEEFLLALELDEKYDTTMSYWSFKDVKEEYIKSLGLDIRTGDEKELNKIFGIMPELIEDYKYPISRKLQHKLCRYNGSLIKFIDNPCEKAKLIASENIYNIRFIKNPTKKMWEIGMKELKNPPSVKGMDLDMGQHYTLLAFKKMLRLIYQEESFYKGIDKHFDESFGPTAFKKLYDKGNKVGMFVLAITTIRKFLKLTTLSVFGLLSNALKLKALKLLYTQITSNMMYGITDTLCERLKECDYEYLMALEHFLLKELKRKGDRYSVGFEDE